jgi:DHA1 family bicyclomycin/chloramphenicol resistance-like MFS transporter
VSVIGTGERGFGLLFGAVMVGNILGSIVGSRLVARLGIDRMIRYSTWLMMLAGLVLAAFAWANAAHPAAIVVPMFVFMAALMTTMPPATAGALTPFPEISGSAASLLLFCQFVMASSAALVVGLSFDGTQRPMAGAIAVTSMLTFASFRFFLPPRKA